MATKETVVFDLNADPGEQLQQPTVPNPCDLALKLSVPACRVNDQSDEMAAESGSQHISTTDDHLGPPFADTMHTSQSRTLAVITSTDPTARGDLVRKLERLAGYLVAVREQPVIKRIEETETDRSPTKKRKTQSGPSSIGNGGMICFSKDHQEDNRPGASSRPVAKKKGVRVVKQAENSKGSGACPKTQTEMICFWF